jgi:hypothetical protein
MLQVQVQETLTPVEKLSMAPFWSTFCGTSNGAWQGVQAAFSPITGRLLAVSLLIVALAQVQAVYPVMYSSNLSIPRIFLS